MILPGTRRGDGMVAAALFIMTFVLLCLAVAFYGSFYYYYIYIYNIVVVVGAVDMWITCHS